MVLEQECQITLATTNENYNTELKKFFADRNEPFETDELFGILKAARDRAIDEFVISGEIREKYQNYYDYLQQLQDFMSLREEKIMEINDNLADE